MKGNHFAYGSISRAVWADDGCSIGLYTAFSSSAGSARSSGIFTITLYTLAATDLDRTFMTITAGTAVGNSTSEVLP